MLMHRSQKKMIQSVTRCQFSWNDGDDGVDRLLNKINDK